MAKTVKDAMNLHIGKRNPLTSKGHAYQQHVSTQKAAEETYHRESNEAHEKYQKVNKAGRDNYFRVADRVGWGSK